jgi:DNA-binding MarR family transcriptional regulator
MHNHIYTLVKTTLKDSMKYSEIDVQMQGELQKAVWSIFKQYKKMSAKDISIKLVRAQSNVTGVITKLIELGAVNKVKHLGKPIRGLYEITEGFTR